MENPAAAFTPPLHLGCLLVAHPALRDPNFHRTVVLITAYEPSVGAMGLILNRPLQRPLCEEASQFYGTPLAGVPLFEGGPVHRDEVLLAAWRQTTDPQTFQLYLGISEDKAVALLHGDPSIRVRAFCGYSGWERQQLEGEFSDHAWLPGNAAAHNLNESEGPSFWRKLVLELRPELLFFENMPEDPSRN